MTTANLTIQDSSTVDQYESTGENQFAFTFPITAAAELKVSKNHQLLVYGVDWSLDPGSLNEPNGGSITLAAGTTPGDIITLWLDMPFERQSGFAAGAATLLPEDLNADAVAEVRRSQQLRRDLQRCLRLPVDDRLAGQDMQLPIASDRSGRLVYFGANGSMELLALTDIDGVVTALSSSLVASVLNSLKRTDGEISAGAVIVDGSYPPGNVLRYGADPSGTIDSTAAIQTAINVGGDVVFPGGTYLANNLTQTHNFQKLVGVGWVRLLKNANGDLFTSSGDDVELNGLGFSGDYTANGYTGDNIVMNGQNPRIINCGSRETNGVPLRATGNHVQVNGTCDIYNTKNAAGYDLEIGQSGTATLYHRIIGIKTSQAGGGFRFTDCGSQVVMACQFGKYTVAKGTGPSGTNGGNCIGNRILGDVTVEISNSEFSANAFGEITVTLNSGTSGHRFDSSNSYAAGAVLVDNSVEATLIDSRLASLKTYTPAWTAASANPDLGDGSLIGRYFQMGKFVYFTIRLQAGATTTFGTGAWYFSLPAAPATFGPQVGQARVLDSGNEFRTGVAVTISDGTARVQVFIDNETAAVDSSRPMSWAAGDELVISGQYLVD